MGGSLLVLNCVDHVEDTLVKVVLVLVKKGFM